ncbi:hypothetical protein MKEN_00671600 [Mycena kentingensis (nom. inval.)]|nr:hypothetical protein MKEN_00671600 [Mycena kentingensis (nom. inval.)]
MIAILPEDDVGENFPVADDGGASVVGRTLESNMVEEEEERDLSVTLTGTSKPQQHLEMQHAPATQTPPFASHPRARSSSEQLRFVDPDRAPTPEHHRRRGFIGDRLAHHTSPSHQQPQMTTNKVNTSPSKATYGRTYDAKVVQREMHRLAGLAPNLSGVSQNSFQNSSLPEPGTMAQVSLASTSNDPWTTLTVNVIPLFNGEHLRVPIEDLNTLVKRHISSVVSSSPSKAIATLEHDAAELIASGMVNLTSKLDVREDETLIPHVVEIWEFFYDQVLTYVEGVLLPLHTDSLLSTLYRSKPHRPSSPRQTSKGNLSSMFNGATQLQSNHIDVRTIALRSFRDKVIVPLTPQLRSCILHRQEKDAAPLTVSQPRLQQLLLVLSSQCRRPSPVSLTSAPQPSSSEAAITDLLRMVRSPRPQFDPSTAASTPISPPRAPSFLSGGLPRDRRGRIGNKMNLGIAIAEDGDEDVFGDETPRIGHSLADRERGREFLEALKSPDVPVKGGWGLGDAEQSGKLDDDEDTSLTWDQAQAQVERLVAIQPDMRRR